MSHKIGMFHGYPLLVLAQFMEFVELIVHVAIVLNLEESALVFQGIE
jgi:hypothetical protein